MLLEVVLVVVTVVMVLVVAMVLIVMLKLLVWLLLAMLLQICLTKHSNVVTLNNMGTYLFSLGGISELITLLNYDVNRNCYISWIFYFCGYTGIFFSCDITCMIKYINTLNVCNIY